MANLLGHWWYLFRSTLGNRGVCDKANPWHGPGGDVKEEGPSDAYMLCDHKCRAVYMEKYTGLAVMRCGQSSQVTSYTNKYIIRAFYAANVVFRGVARFTG